MGNLTRNFNYEEFDCRCGCRTNLIKADLVLNLQKIRDHFGRPVHVNSGYRCVNHNRKAGGSPKSQHLYGRAADIQIKGVAPEAIAALAETLEDFRAGGIGLYDTFVHLDIRRSGPSRWDFRTAGKEAEKVA